MNSIRIPLFTLLAFLAPRVFAFTSVNSAGNQGRLTGGILLQDAQYQTNDSYDVDATMLLVAYKAALGPKFALGGGLGLVVDGEIGRNNKATDGKGFRLFVDGQFDIKQFNRNLLIGNFCLTHDRFSFTNRAGNISFDTDFKMTEIKFGGLLMHRADSLSFYGGLEAYLYSNGEVETGNLSSDTDRDERLNVRFGAAFAVDSSLDLRADLYLLSEQTVFFGADFRI